MELYEFKRKTEDLLKFRVLYESLKIKETEREAERIEKLTKKEFAR